MSTESEPGPGTNPYGVRCSRCGRTQPPNRAPSISRWPYCIYCSAPLWMTRWVARPPAGLGPAPRIRRLDRPYVGPPGYGAGHPEWGFPPVAKLRGDVAESVGAAASGSTGLPGLGISNNLGISENASVRDGASTRSDGALGRRLTAAISLTLATASTCFAAAAAEGWRFALMLRGRTEILPGRPIRASDTAVIVSSVAALILAVAAVLASSMALLALYRAAAAHLDLDPVRNSGDIAARFFVPGWNLYGAGQIVVEVMHLVFRPVDGIGRTPPRWMHHLVRICWAAWIVNGLATAAILVFSVVPALPWQWGDSNQFAANLVEAHVALNLIAGITAALFAATLAALRNEWFGSRFANRSKWIVAQPVSSARNRQPHGRAPQKAPDMTTVRSAASPLADTTTATAPKRSADVRAHTGQHRRR